MQNDHELDRIIDAALPGYSSAEPRPGLERRILAHATAAQARSSRPLWPWLLAIPALACLLFFVFLVRPNQQPERRQLAASEKNAATITPPSREVGATPALPSRPKPLQSLTPRAPATTDSSLPKQDVFPTPSPLTAEERAFIVVSRAPVPTAKHSEAATLNIDPIHIAELRIEPLNVPPLDSSESTQSIQQDKQP